MSRERNPVILAVTVVTIIAILVRALGIFKDQQRLTQFQWIGFSYHDLGENAYVVGKLSTTAIESHEEFKLPVRPQSDLRLATQSVSKSGEKVTAEKPSKNAPIDAQAESGVSSIHIQVTNDRVLVSYVYYETKNARANFLYFIEHGLHDGADFLIILNGDTTVQEKIPVKTNIKVIARENKCFDLGTHAEVFKDKKLNLVNKYKRFILMNSSIRGPFLPYWSKGCWTDLYLNKLTDVVKVRNLITHWVSKDVIPNPFQLVGMTVNCYAKPKHVQSMLWAVDKVGLSIIMNSLAGIDHCFETLKAAVGAEKGTTSEIINAGYKIDVMQSSFQGEADGLNSCGSGDIWFDDGYFNTMMHPYETIFVKANRAGNPKTYRQVSLLTQWHDSFGRRSNDVCGKGEPQFGHWYLDEEKEPSLLG
ncbi:hypothetical protein MMC09_007005 [Bachmanniomyces sp. S44760]|nr:hypothetical protein [Bachmanniomyces sp. S44760]